MARRLEGVAPDFDWDVRMASRFAVPSGTIYVVDGSPKQRGPIVTCDDAARTAQRVAEELGNGDIWVEVTASGDAPSRAYVVDGIGGRTWGPIVPRSNTGWTEYGSLDG
jgi:hypothetical protein